MINSSCIQAVLVAVFTLLTQVAHAGFSIEGSPTVSSERPAMGRFQPYEANGEASFRPASPSMDAKQARYKDAELLVDLAYKPVTQEGSGRAEVFDGFADDVPLNAAMSMILPTGWQLYKNGTLDKRDVPETISFTGGKTWPEILGQIGDRYALAFHVDWYQRTVMLRKGRESAASQASRIKVIPEPVRVTPKSSPSIALAKLPPTSSGTQASGAVVTAAPKDKPLSASSSPVSPGAKPLATAQAKLPVAPAPAVANPAVKPAPIMPPAEVTIDVLPGTLQENVIRLSAKNGWNPPEWLISGDYRVTSGYTLRGKTFPEVMVKLLMLHPIEADVSVAERKVKVLKELM